jgi:hypothetical protein
MGTTPWRWASIAAVTLAAVEARAQTAPAEPSTSEGELAPLRVPPHANATQPPLALRDNERVAPVSPPLSDVVPSARVWYGWQVLVVDLVALGFGVASIASTGDAKLLLSITALTLATAGGPVVHGVHGQGIHAAKSLALRAGLMLGLAPVGLLIDFFGAPTIHPPSGSAIGGISTRPISGVATGIAMLIGFVPASIVDVAAISYAPRTRQQASVSPWLAPSQGGLQAGLLGVF